MVTVSFDYDDTICEEISIGWGGTIKSAIYPYVDLLKEYIAFGVDVLIVTARTNNSSNLDDIVSFLESQDIKKEQICDIIFTNHQLKGPFCKKNKVNLHYDDDLSQIESCINHGIKTIHVK